jgi:hypothetical protein
MQLLLINFKFSPDIFLVLMAAPGFELKISSLLLYQLYYCQLIVMLSDGILSVTIRAVQLRLIVVIL